MLKPAREYVDLGVWYLTGCLFSVFMLGIGLGAAIA